MEKVIIIYEEHVIDFLNDLIFDLFKKEYFSYQESAIDYVNKIYDFIDNNILIYPHKKTPQQLIYKGKYYIFYKANDDTTWFIFFDKMDVEFLITGIINNHIMEANCLNVD